MNLDFLVKYLQNDIENGKIVVLMSDGIFELPLGRRGEEENMLPLLDMRSEKRMIYFEFAEQAIFAIREKLDKCTHPEGGIA